MWAPEVVDHQRWTVFIYRCTTTDRANTRIRVGFSVVSAPNLRVRPVFETLAETELSLFTSFFLFLLSLHHFRELAFIKIVCTLKTARSLEHNFAKLRFHGGKQIFEMTSNCHEFVFRIIQFSLWKLDENDGKVAAFQRVLWTNSEISPRARSVFCSSRDALKIWAEKLVVYLSALVKRA